MKTDSRLFHSIWIKHKSIFMWCIRKQPVWRPSVWGNFWCSQHDQDSSMLRKYRFNLICYHRTDNPKSNSNTTYFEIFWSPPKFFSDNATFPCLGFHLFVFLTVFLLSLKPLQIETTVSCSQLTNCFLVPWLLKAL